MMRALFSDTSPTAEQVQLELLRRALVQRKLHMVEQMSLTVRALALSGLRGRYPLAGEAELRRRLANLLLGAELAARVCGPFKEMPEDDR